MSRPVAVVFALRVACISLLAACATAPVHGQVTTTPADGGPAWASVQRALGGRGSMQAGDVLRFGFPRSDLTVVANGVTLRPTFALGSWVAFKRMAGSNDAVVMGDLVLTEDEVTAVMTSLQANGVEQTALHHHVLHESPRVLYMHIDAHGDAAKLSQAIRTALAKSKTPMTPPPAGPVAPFSLDTAAIARALGVIGRVT